MRILEKVYSDKNFILAIRYLLFFLIVVLNLVFSSNCKWLLMNASNFGFPSIFNFI